MMRKLTFAITLFVIAGGVGLYARQLNAQDSLVVPVSFSNREEGIVMQRTYLKTNEILFAENGADGLKLTWRGITWTVQLNPEQKQYLELSSWSRTGEELIPPVSCVYFAIDIEIKTVDPVKLGEIRDVNCFTVIQSQQVIPFNYYGVPPATT